MILIYIYDIYMIYIYMWYTYIYMYDIYIYIYVWYIYDIYIWYIYMYMIYIYISYIYNINHQPFYPARKGISSDSQQLVTTCIRRLVFVALPGALAPEGDGTRRGRGARCGPCWLIHQCWVFLRPPNGIVDVGYINGYTKTSNIFKYIYIYVLWGYIDLLVLSREWMGMIHWLTIRLSTIIPATPIPIHSLLSTSKLY